MTVAKPVEFGGRALSISAHVLKVQPVADIKFVVEANALSDTIDAVTSGSPDLILHASGGSFGHAISERCIVKGPVARSQHLGNGVLMIEHDAAEVAV